MPSTSGKAKLERVISQLENIQVLIGGLPKYMVTVGERRKNMMKVLEELQDIEEQILFIYSQYEDNQSKPEG